MKNIRNAFLFILSVCALFIFSSCALSGGGQDTERGCTTHMWDVGSVQRGATCFEEGEYIYHCLYCLETKLESIPQLEHTYYDGWIDDEEYHYHLCYLCSQDVKDKEAHSWDEGVVIEATCTQRGSVTYTCTVCFHTKTEEIPQLEHTYSNEWTIDEWQHYHASTCGCEDKRADAENHKWDEGVVITPATCVEDGSALHTCTVCSATKVFTIRRTYEHIWDDGVVTPPTCTDMGYTTHTCTVCGHSVKGSYVGSISHEYIPSITAPTCTEEGYTTYTCSGCNHSYKSNYVAKTGHSYETKVVSPTCSARGYTVHTCTACGDSYQDTYTDRPPHSYEVYCIEEPTCTARGYTIYKCSVCFIKHYDDYTSMIPHPYESVVIEPTCTAMGYTVYTCSACADTYTADYTDIIDHDYEFVSATESTCTESGYRSYACVDCGAT
ncbi:MAG: hypothetical protein IKB20_01690, partial [Clostridia bacterium]|nr:hypothetical protein [Clostridia bacterium]